MDHEYLEMIRDQNETFFQLDFDRKLGLMKVNSYQMYKYDTENPQLIDEDNLKISKVKNYFTK